MANRASEMGCVAAVVAAIVAGAAMPAGAAEEGIQEVVITAQKREENLQTAPLAISALSSDVLEKRGVTDFKGIAESTPSINVTPYPASNNILILYMRGQGVADSNQITSDGSVALYQDGFYISRPQLSTFDLADVERVEVLRGPQGTLYGRNTTGGAVNIISRKPSGESDFRASISAGQRGYWRALATIDMPKVGNALSAKVSLLYSDLDGLVKNPGNGEDFGKQKQQAGRLSLRWDAGGPVTADYFYEHGKLSSTAGYYQNSTLLGKIPGYTALGADQTTAYRAIDLPLGVGEYDAHGISVTWDVNDTTTFKSLTGYRGLVSDFTQDYADAFTDPLSVAFTGRVGFRSYDNVHSHTLTQEFQLVGDLGKQIKYVAGLFYFEEGGIHAQRVNINIPAFFYDQTNSRYVTADAKSKAAYVQATWIPGWLDDRLDFTFGARYTKDNRDAGRDIQRFITGVGVIGSELGAKNSQSFSKFNPAFTASYKVSDDVNTYLRVATGYKAGGSSEAGDIGTFGLTFGPEKVTTYEIGLKSYWLDRKVRLNLAAFQSKFEDMQLQFNTNPADLSVVLGLNAGKAKVNGLEVEFFTQPTQDLSIGIDWAYLDAKIDEVIARAGTAFDPRINPASIYKVGDNVAPVFRLPYAPKNVFTVTADWTFFRSGANSLSGSLNYRWQDKQWMSAPTGPAVPNNDLYALPAYGLLGARLVWNHEVSDRKNLRVALWGRNVTDEKYPAHLIGQGASLRIQTPTGIQQPGLYYQSVQWAEKSRYGIDLVYGF